MSTQIEWADYAANIAGDWELCANCEGSAAAKKLFRQYNFNRNILGLPQASSPIDNTEFADLDVSLLDMIFSPYPNVLSVQWTFGQTDDLQLAIVQQGQGFLNPACQMITANNLVILTSGTMFDFALAISNIIGPPAIPGVSDITNLLACTSTADGAPGKKTEFNVRRFLF